MSKRTGPGSHHSDHRPHSLWEQAERSQKAPEVCRGPRGSGEVQEGGGEAENPARNLGPAAPCPHPRSASQGCRGRLTHGEGPFSCPQPLPKDPPAASHGFPFRARPPLENLPRKTGWEATRCGDAQGDVRCRLDSKEDFLRAALKPWNRFARSRKGHSESKFESGQQGLPSWSLS